MLFVKLLSKSLVYQLSLLLLILPHAKAVPWERCMIVPTLHQENEPPVLLDWFIQISLAPCLWNHVLALVMSSLSSMTIWDMHLLPSYTTKMLLHSIFRLWYPGLKSLLVTRSSLYIQTEGGNLWLENYNRSSVLEVSLTRHLFLIHPNKMVVQRGSIELCLKKQKPYTYMLVCHDLSGKMLVKLHCIFTYTYLTTNASS